MTRGEGSDINITMEILKKLKENPSNPRTITKVQFQKLKEKIRSFPEMLEKRPIIYDDNYTILGGNMRFRAIKQLANEGMEIKDSYFMSANGWSEEQIKQFIITDNISDGAWDEDVLANEWSDLPLKEWGLDFVPPENNEEGEIPFTEELNEQHNYIVLYFDNEMDWLNLQTLYPLPTVKALDAKDGYERKGVGRVVKGVDFIRKLRNEN